jgi:hypothetical protein
LIHHLVERSIGTRVRTINYLTIIDSVESLIRFKLSVGFRSRAVAFRVPPVRVVT